MDNQMMNMEELEQVAGGGIADFFSGIGGTITNSVLTVYHSVVDTGEYVFTNKSSEECYTETRNAARKVAESLESCIR